MLLQTSSICTTVFCVLKKNDGLKNVASGANHMRRNRSNCDRSIHSEEEALYNLPSNNKKKIELILIVIKMSHNGKLGMSKPCSNCIKKLQNIRGYYIRYIYYSDSTGNIIKTKLSDLILEEQHISRYFKKIEFYNH
jgi:deoxycytidylate deaminase